MSKKYELLFRLLLCGDAAVGKSCLLWRFADDDFNPNHLATIGIDFKLKTMRIDEKTVKIQCWDTAGQERYESLSHNYYRRAEGIILVYDITRAETFYSLEKWMNLIRDNAPEAVEVVLVGNKSDREEARQVSYHQGMRLAQANGYDFFETSAYSSIHVNDTFQSLVRRLLWRKLSLRAEAQNPALRQLTSQASIVLQPRSAPPTPPSRQRSLRPLTLGHASQDPDAALTRSAARDPSPDSLLRLQRCMDGGDGRRRVNDGERALAAAHDSDALATGLRGHAPLTRAPRLRPAQLRPNSFASELFSSSSSEEDADLPSPSSIASLSPPAASRQTLNRSVDALDRMGWRRSGGVGGAKFSFAEDTQLRRQSSLLRLEKKLSGSIRRSTRSLKEGECGRSAHDGKCCKMA